MFSDGPRARRPAGRRKEADEEDLEMTNGGSQKEKRRRRRRIQRMHRIRLVLCCALGSMLLALSCWIGFRVSSSPVAVVPPTATPTIFLEPNVPAKMVEYSSNDEPPAILIVGGTDGSGTRGFCSALTSLGVDMVVDDAHTMDVEATQLFQKKGWPALVNFVLNQTKGSLQYTWDDLSSDAKTVLKHEVKAFSMHLQLAHKNMKHKQKKIVGLQPDALRIKFAIKAPASMLVFPVLRHVFEAALESPVKFLHIVRDGRDMSLSQNQSPVQKFYNSTYPNDYKERSAKWEGELYNVRAMQLWNDWNLQVWKNNREDVNYMMARSEDLIGKRWEVLQGLHKFVGSSLRLEDLCCQSQMKPRDMGESVKFVDVEQARKGRPPKSDEQLKRNLEQMKMFEGLSLSNWTKKADEVMQTKENDNLDPRAMELRLADQVEGLLVRGIKFDTKDAEGDGDLIWSLMEKLEGMAAGAFEKDFNAWKKSVVARDRADIERQNPFLQKTGKALLDRSNVLIASISAFQANESNLQPNHPESKVFKIRALVKEIQRLEFALKSDAGEFAVHTAQNAKTSIEKRYGKWQGMLENRELLSKHLHEEGALGLKEFGYEPFRSFLYPTLGYDCTQEQFLKCSEKQAQAKPRRALPNIPRGAHPPFRNTKGLIRRA